jgi:hypothetical protein
MWILNFNEKRKRRHFWRSLVLIPEWKFESTLIFEIFSLKERFPLELQHFNCGEKVIPAAC